jgi:PadR family transcriptional regulator AphA
MKSKPIRLTHTSYAVLSLLNLLGEATPYELKQLLERSIENFWPIPHTTFYAEPERLAGAGYLSSEQESGGRRRKRYALTDSGREALAAWAQDTDVAPPQYRDEAMLKIFAGADPRPIMAQRREWHVAKLAELERCLEEVRAADGPAGVERSLLAGTTYHRQMLEPIERFLAEAPEDVENDSSSARSRHSEDARSDGAADASQAATGTSPGVGGNTSG